MRGGGERFRLGLFGSRRLVVRGRSHAGDRRTPRPVGRWRGLGAAPLALGAWQCARPSRAPPQVAAGVDFVASLPIEVDAETDRRSFREVFSLARSASLTTYDAAYLELALRSGLALATLDKALVQAARDLQVKTLPRTIR